jgi:hypothetical protein
VNRVVVVLTVLLLGCVQDPQLTPYQVPGTALEVQMPLPVTTTTKTVTLAGEEVVGYARTAIFDDVEYAVVNQRIPEPVREQIARRSIHDVLDAAQAELVAATRGTFQKQVGVALPIGKASFQGREVTLLMPGSGRMMIARLIPTDEQYYQILVTMPAKPSYDQRLYATRFLESAHLQGREKSLP